MTKHLIILLMLFYKTALTQTIIFSEDFSSGALPAGWTTDSAGFVPVNNWSFTSQPSTVNGAGFDNKFPRVTCYGSSRLFDCSLISSSFNCLLQNTVYLTFSEQSAVSNSLGAYAIRSAEISTNGGINWITVFNCTNCMHGWPTATKTIIDISNVAGGQSNLKIRFRYQALFNGWWAIDNILVTDSAGCISPPDSGITTSSVPWACTGSNLLLSIDNLSRGIGQTYQWQLKNAATGNVFSNITGATTDTLTVTQNGTTYYQCLVTCGGLSTNSKTLLVVDTPNAASAVNNGIHICFGRDDTLSLLQPYGGSGVTYQWSTSFNYLTGYADIPGAVYDTFMVNANNFFGSNFFKCRQICASNGASREGYWVNEVINPNPLCYCYPFSNNPCSNGYFISGVSIAGTTLQHTAVCKDNLIVHLNNNNYQFFDPALGNTTATLTRNTTYNLTMSTDSMWQYFSMWLDYNRNGSFEASEYTFGQYALPGVPAQVSFTVPINATPGLTGMRIRSMRWYGINDSTLACNNITGGSTYDYFVTIDSTVSISDLGFGISDLKLFPNPAAREVLLTSSAKIKNVNVVTITGSVALMPSLSLRDKGANTIKIDVSLLPTGFYFVNIETEKGIVVRKFVKE